MSTRLRYHFLVGIIDLQSGPASSHVLLWLLAKPHQLHAILVRFWALKVGVWLLAKAQNALLPRRPHAQVFPLGDPLSTPVFGLQDRPSKLSPRLALVHRREAPLQQLHADVLAQEEWRFPDIRRRHDTVVLIPPVDVGTNPPAQEVGLEEVQRLSREGLSRSPKVRSLWRVDTGDADRNLQEERSASRTIVA